MQSITFSVPVLAASQMSKQDQIDIVVNQATASIVCCYLEHMNTFINKGSTGSAIFFEVSELVALINSVQGALRTIP